MRMTQKVLIIIAISLAVLSAAPANTVVMDFGNTTSTVNADFSNIPYTQNVSSTQFSNITDYAENHIFWERNTSISLPNFKPQNLFLNFSLSGANPNSPFHIDLYNVGFNEYYTFAGDTSNATSSTSNIALNYIGLFSADPENTPNPFLSFAGASLVFDGTGETIQAMSVFNLNFKSVAVWNSGSGNWTTTSQWNSNTPPVDGDTVEFSGAGGTSTNDFASGNLSAISGLTFTSNATGAYTVNGNTLQVGEDGIANASNQTQTIAINLTLGANQTFAANTANLIVSGNISGGYALTKEGNQTLTLAGANTYTGETSINAGTVAIASGGSLAGTSKIFVGNSTSDNALEILGSVGTGNLTLSHQVGSNNNTVTVGNGTSPASLTVSNLLNVGFGGTGNTLNILGNGTVTAGSTEIGGYGANNTLNLTGGHLNSTGYLVVGYNADGNALNITSGGNATVGSVTVGLDAGSSNNTILVSGSGSALHTPGLIYLGQNGTNNSLLVQNGGKVVSGNPDAVMGFNAGSNGNALSINGTGSQFTNNGTLYIGRNGSENFLTVQNGASLVSRNSRIGHEAVSSNNTATVSGAGTTWANTGTLRVGNLGSNNTLAVTSGANVTISGDTFIGHGAGSENNLVSVEGAGSVLNLANAIVGLSGSNNKLLVADSGTINAIGIQLSGTNATLQIGNGAAGGTITTSLGIGTGTGTSHQVIFNHTDSNLVFSPILTGNLSVSQIGTGTTTLTASNTYTGITTIDAGILATSGNDRIATGNSVIVNAPGTFTLGGNQTLASVSGTGTIQLGDYILSTGDSNSTYSGTLAGNGGLTKSGNGTFTLTGNGTFTGDTNITGGTLVLASNSTLSKDAVVIMAAGTTLTVNQRTFIGALEQGGGTVNGNGTLVVTLTITDSGSLDSVLANGPDYAAGILKRTSGTTTIGAANTFTGVVKIQDGILQLTGNGSFDSGSSLVLNPGGTMDLNNKSQTFSAVSGAGGTISMGSGSLTVNQSTDTTYNGIVTGSGSLNKQGGGTLTLGGNNTYNGSTTVSAGTLAVTGSLYGTSSLNINAGSVNANSGNLAVIGNISLGGASSNNTLQISNGGAVSGYYMSAGFNLGANNNLVTVGANSTLTLSDKFDVGFDGSSNNLTITNGGQVFLGAGGSSIGSFRARDNSVLIDGPGSKLTNVGVYYVGFQGEGNQLTLSNQGRLVSDNLSAGGSVGVGVGNGSNNTILVTSNASMLINGELSVGGAGASNSMTISGGGNVTSTEGFIGRDIISSNNTVTVTGTNSTWTNNGTLYVGYQGSNNTLAVANSGTVTASSISIASQAGSGGTLNIGTFGGSDTGGTINAPSIAFGNGTGTINFNQSNAMSLSGNISGNGSVNKLGTGTTTLSGANTYTGSTTISAGTLAVTGSLNGTTSLDVNGGSLAVTGGVTANGSVNANSGTITIGQGGALNVTGSTTTTTTIDALFASNRGSSTISVFDRSNNAFVAAIGSGHLNTPLGLAISSNGSIYAANNGGNSISIFGANGAYTGNIMGNLNYPYGLAISSNGTLYAANYYGNSISIFGANGTYTGNITANLNRPEGLAISSNGTLYAANFDGNSISIFGANGTYTGNITGNLNYPLGLAISSNGTLYAANYYGNSISIFGANGTYTGNITGNLNYPYGLAISSNGTLYAANNVGNSISIFGVNGTYTGNITGNLSYPAFVAIGNYTQEILVPNGLTLATSASDTATLNLGTFGGNDTTATLTASFVQFGNGTAAMNLNLAGTTTLSSDLLGGNSNSTINQLGTGTTTLTSANSTYAGRVNVNAGTLVVTGSLNGTSTIDLNGGTLAITGSVTANGSVNANSGTITIGQGGSLAVRNTTTIQNTPSLFVGDSANNDISAFSLQSNDLLGKFSGNRSYSVLGLAIDGSGNIYASYDGVGEIGKFSSNGTFLNAISVSSFTQALAIDSSGNLYAAHPVANTIDKFSSNGTLLFTISGNLGEPRGLAIDGNGNLYATNTTYERKETISKFSSNGTFLNTISGNFSGLWNLAIDESGNLYVPDTVGGGTINKFSSNGTFLSGIPINTGGNPAFAIDGSGNLYAANPSDNTVSKFSSNGTFLSAFSGLNGPAAFAIGNYTQEFTTSNGLTLAASSNDTATLNLGTYGGSDTSATLDTPFIAFGNGIAAMNLNLAGDTTVSADLLGGNSNSTLNQLGTGTTTLTSANSTYAGKVNVNAGTLQMGASLANASFTVNGGTLAGGNITIGDVVINSGGAIAHGNSPGRITTGNMTWNGGGSYKWELASVNGTAGTDWDLINSAGSLTINATSGDKFSISLTSFGNGTLAGVKKASWEIGNFTTGITGFDKSYFSFNSIGMTGSVGGYSLSLGGGNTTLLLNYKTGAVWNTGSGDWTTLAQWEGSTPPVDGDAVEFSGTGGISTNNYASGNLSEISGLTFTSSANGSYTINGNALTLGAGGLVNDSSSAQTVAIGVTLGADQTFAANTANLVVSGNISGNASLTKAGSETLTLSGSNTYTGETLVEAGTLAIASSGSLTGTSKILMGNFTSGNTMSVLGSVFTGNLTLSEHSGSNDNTLTVGGGSTPASLTVGNLINVGFGGEGNTLDILGNGTVTAASTWIGGYGASNTVNLTGGVLNSTTDVIVGYFAGENALNITAGGNATVGSIIAGLDASSSNNTILVSGSSSALQTSGLIYLGQNGTSNSLVVENGGKVLSQNADAVIGLNAGSNGNALSINGTGSRFTNNGTLYVGRTGSNNTLSVANGGSLVTKNSRIGGDAASSNNTVTVSGAGSVWNNTGTLRVGSFGSNNTLAVTSGANVTVAGNTFIGYNATSANNLVSVEGAGSVLNLANATIGLSGANNTLRVADLGTINAVGIQLSGSDSTLQIGNGAAAGTINTSLGIGTGTGSGHQVVFNHTDSNLSFSPILTGNLSLKQIGTGKTILATNNTYTGTTTVNNGTLEVASGGSINGTSDIFVGLLNGDNGTLHLNGGSVSNARGYLGAQVGSVGAATVSAGNWTNSGSLFVGVGGTGSLTINGTGHVTNEDGYIGHISGSTGTVGVSGGTWTNNINLFIGNNGTGSLTISGTGNVTSMFGSVGNLPGGNGTVSVSGGTWTNSLDLSIGNGGTGSLVINGTGNVTSMFGYIGSLPDGNGTVSVSGGTWTNSSNLTIGIGGTGSLTINGTGTVIVGDTLSRGSNGRINLESGGTLQIGNGGTTGTLATDLTNNGTLIFDVTDSSTSGYAISGTGIVDKTGAGTLVLSGSSSNYSGATSIKAGTLLLDSGYSNTASAVSVLSNGTLGGSGTAGDVTVLANATMSPGGNAPVGISTFSISSGNPEIATLTVGNLTLNGGANYNWQTLSLNGIGEAGRDWDLIRSTGGSLSINASANSTVGIRVSTLDGGFTNQNKKAKWQIGSFTDITGYDKSYFSVNASGTGARGRFFVTDEANSLVLNYKTAAVWLGGTGNWTTASLWEDRYIAVDGDEVEFSGNGGTSTNSDVNSVASLTFTSIASGSYTLNGNALAVGAAGIVNDSEFEHTIALNLTGGEVLRINTAVNNLTISGVISGNSGLTKNGSQTLTLLATNSYIDGTTVSAGTLALGGTAGAIIGNISVDSGATFAVNRTNDATISNLISGNGSFAQVGSGVTSMATNNTYSGGTSITSGTLWAKSARALGNGSVTLGQFEKSFSLIPPPSTAALLVSSRQEMGGNLRIDGNLDWYDGKIAYFDTGSSPLSGDLTINVAGSFHVNTVGNATFDFSGVEALDYGNYTLVNATAGVSAPSANFVAVHGPYTTLFGNFTTSNTTVVYTVTGAVSGGSDIQNNGGPNTPVVANYNITGPTVTIGENNQVNALTFSSSAPLAIQSNGELTVTSGTLAVQTGSSVVSGGTLVAPEGLKKDGTGELDFTNNVVVTGTAAVNAGLLSVNGQLQATGGVVVNPNATLGGAGLIVGNVNVNGGNISPGNSPGTLSVAGNLVLTGANATLIEIASPTNFDRIVVSGTATLGGTLNAVAYGGGTITPGARYDFLQAGSIVGAFDSLIAPDGLRIRFLNSGTVGSLLFGPASFVPYALNQNQINVAKALDIFVLATEGDAIVVGTALDSLTTEQFPAAFDQIMPGFYESLANMAIEQAFNQTQMLNQRISSVRLGAAGFQAIGGISQPLVHDKNGKSAAEAKDASPIVESATATNWNAWALGTGMFSRTTNLGRVDNYNNDAGGFLVGSDYRWSENFVTGLYGGYDYSYAEYNGGGSTKGNSFSFGTYASYAKDGYYADAVIGGGYTGFQTKRSIAFSTIDRTASADPNSGQFTAGLNLGKDFEVGKFTLGPIVGAQYTYAGIGSFTESGAESLDLSLGQQNANSLRSTLGGRVAYTWNLNQKIALIPEVRMFWQHEFLNNPRTINASLDGGSGPSFGYETTDPYRNSVFAGAGVTAQFGKNLSGSVFYNINFGSQTYQNNMVSAGLNISF